MDIINTAIVTGVMGGGGVAAMEVAARA